MPTIKQIIYEVDKEIKIKRSYLHKKHRNGIFDFQLSQEQVEPYKVEHDKYIYPFVKTLLGEQSYNEIQDIYLLVNYNADNFYKEYFNTGRLARTVLLNKTGLLVVTEYYKNVAPQNYAYKFTIPEDPVLQLTVLQKLAYQGAKLEDSMELELYIHFKEDLRQIMKQLNPGVKFNTDSKFPLQKQTNDITWKEVKLAVVGLVNKLDDTCVNIFNRVDYINFLSDNVSEIKLAIDEMNIADRQEFIKFHSDNKDWFGLIVEAIDLTKNKTYKDYVDHDKVKEQAKRIGEVMQYIILNVITDSTPKVEVKKKKI